MTLENAQYQLNIYFMKLNHPCHQAEAIELYTMMVRIPLNEWINFFVGSAPLLSGSSQLESRLVGLVSFECVMVIQKQRNRWTYFPHQSSFAVVSSLTTRLSLGDRPVLAPESVAKAPLDVMNEPFSFWIACSYSSTKGRWRIEVKKKKKYIVLTS